MARSSSRRRSTVAACIVSGLLSILSTSSHAGVCDAAALGCSTGGACTVTGTWEIDSNCTIDFGTADVVLKGTLKATSTSGAFRIKAATLELQGGKVRSLGDVDHPGGNLVIEVAGAFRMSGTGPRIDTSGAAGGGTIQVSASTVDVASGVIAAEGGGGSTCGDAGTISVEASAGELSSQGIIRSTTSGPGCYGGQISLKGASVSLLGDVDARGGASGSDRAIVVEASTGDIVVAGGALVRADGTGQPDGSGADAGNIELHAANGNVRLESPSISLTGNSPDGVGGELSIKAAGNVEVLSRVVAYGGLHGSGGRLEIDSGASITIGGDVLATGGSSADGEGGSVELAAVGDVAVTALVDLSGTEGGSLEIARSQAVVLPGTIVARGVGGKGGQIEIHGCNAQIAGRLDSGSNNGGEAGTVSVSSATLAVATTGRIEALPCTSGSCISFATASNPSLATGAVINPPPVTSPDPLPGGC